MDPDTTQQVYYRKIEDALHAHGYRLFRVYEQTHEWPTDNPLLRRVNLCFMSGAFAASHPYRLSRELFRVRREHEKLAEQVSSLKDANSKLERQVTETTEQSAYQCSWLEWHARNERFDLQLDALPHERKFWAPDVMLAPGTTNGDGRSSLAMTYPGVDGTSAVPSFVFGISLAATSAVADWDLTTALLGRTLRSVLNQSDPRWRAVIVGHDRPGLPELDDPRVTFVVADIEPPTEPKHRRKDKMRKRRLAARFLRDLGGGYFCPLDADDLVHRDLVKHVRSDDNRRGYTVESGFVEGRQPPAGSGAWCLVGVVQPGMRDVRRALLRARRPPAQRRSGPEAVLQPLPGPRVLASGGRGGRPALGRDPVPRRRLRREPQPEPVLRDAAHR